MELINLFLTAFWLAFSGAMMPGPMLTVTINETMKRGKIAGPLIVLGHGILELALVAGLIFGLNLIITNQSVTAAIGIVGGGFLLWMGWDMIRGVYSGLVSLNLEDRGDTKNIGPVLAGIMTSLSNPYFTLWWATAGLTLLTMAQRIGTLGIGVFYAGHILADLVWYAVVSYAVAGGKRFMSDKVYRGIITVCGGFLIVLAGMFFTEGIRWVVGQTF